MKGIDLSKEFVSSLHVSRSRQASCERSWPKISIVMPAFNQAAFVEKSLLSVFNQGYPNLELIVIDGGSTDGTLEIIEKYQHLLAYKISEPDRGQSDALNKGFRQATGDIVGWLNSDDLYLPGAFFCIATAFIKNPDKGIVFGDRVLLDKEDNVVDYKYSFDFNLDHHKFEGFQLNAQSMLWRRDVHLRFGEFDIDLHYTMDYDLILSIGINEGECSFLRVHEPICGFRRYSGQKTGSNSIEVVREHMAIAHKYGFDEKYTRLGKLKRFRYRLRRAYWYLKRGGVEEVFRRLGT